MRLRQHACLDATFVSNKRRETAQAILNYWSSLKSTRMVLLVGTMRVWPRVRPIFSTLCPCDDLSWKTDRLSNFYLWEHFQKHNPSPSPSQLPDRMFSLHNNILTFAHTKSFTLIKGQLLVAVASSEAARRELLPGKCVGILGSRELPMLCEKCWHRDEGSKPVTRRNSCLSTSIATNSSSQQSEIRTDPVQHRWVLICHTAVRVTFTPLFTPEVLLDSK